MTDERLGQAAGQRLRDKATPPPSPHASIQNAMAQVRETKQVHRRWWLPSWRRKAVHSPDIAQTTDYQPSRIPATNGHTPTIIGRTQSMLSPVKAITAGALVFALGGVLLIAQPFDQRSSVPGAESVDVAPTWVTGDILAALSCSADPDVMDGDVRRSRNVECNPQAWTSSDSRLTGRVARRWNDDVYQTDEGSISVSMGAAFLRNEGGGWVCSDSSLLRGFGKSSEAVTGTTFTCIGDGGYEGLSAILVSEYTVGFAEEFVGLIFSGDFPPLPEAPAVE